MPVILIALLLHALIAWRLLPDLPPAAAWAVGAWLVVSVVVMPLSFVRRRRARPARPAAARRDAAAEKQAGERVNAGAGASAQAGASSSADPPAHADADEHDGASRLAWAGLLLMGAFSTLFVLTLLRDLLLALAWAGQGLWAVLGGPAAGVAAGAGAPSLAGMTAAAVPLLALAITALGYHLARRRAPVVRVDVPLAGLPAALHGFTIVQISDVHVGPTIRHRHLQAIVGAVNALQADMVAITGDLVDGTVADLRHHVSPLQRLASRHGTYFVTGNHEYYSGAHAWIAELRRLGVRVLMNEHVVLRHDGAALLLAGVADHGAHHFDASHRSDPHAAVAGAPPEAAVRVLLAHQPRSASAAAEAGFHLQLSGHTHGGQFWPWNHFVRLQQPFTAGLHRLRDLWVYTSRGTGYWGPPKRFGAPSEITHLRLVSLSDTATAGRMLQSGDVR